MMAVVAPTVIANNNQPEVSVAQLFGLDNPQGIDDVLRSHLVQAANMCDVFELFNHKISYLDAGAKALIKYECHTLRALVANQDLFDPAGKLADGKIGPKWSVTEESDAREAILFLKTFLTEKRSHLFKECCESRPKNKSRSRSPEKSRKRRRRRRHSSRSSSTSSQRRQHRTDETKDIIDKSEFRFVGEEYFPKASLIKAVAKHKVSEKSSAYLSSTPIEDWIPSYIGADVPSKEQKKLVSSRRDQGTLGGHQVIEHVIAFWCSHGINGSIHPNSVVKFVFLINKLCADKSKGPSYALTYFKNLVAHIRKVIADSDSVISRLDEFLVKLIMEPLTKTEVAQVGRAPPSGYAPRVHLRSSDTRGAGTYPFPPPPPIIPSPVRDQRRKSTSAPPGSPGLKGKSSKVCIFHDPAKALKCVHGDACQYRHLDTNKSDMARLHKEATESFEGARRRNRDVKKGVKGDVDSSGG